LPPSPRRRLRLAVFSPLPPQGTGVADYLRDLLPSLLALVDVDLFVDDYTPSPGSVPAGCGVYPHQEFPVRRAEQPYDLPVYHVGNSPFHEYLYPYVSRFPGLLVLHDQTLHHLVAGLAEDGRSGFYFREMAYNLGMNGVQQAFEVMMGDYDVPFYAHPLNQRMLDASLGVAVHSEFLAHALRSHAHGTPVERIPMGIPLPPDPGPKPALRQRLGLPETAFIVGSFGQATLQKRIPQVIEAVAGLADAGVDVHYLVVGTVAGDLDRAALTGPPGLAGRVTVTGYVNEAEFQAYLHAVDACVNLRYPTAGETSAAALRCMAAGQPTLVTNTAAGAEFPDTACLKIPLGPGEVPMLQRALQVMHDHPEAAARLGVAARDYVATEHGVAVAAASFIAFARRLLASPVGTGNQGSETTAASPLLKEVAQHLKALGVTAGDLPVLREVAEAVTFVAPRTDYRERVQEAR